MATAVGKHVKKSKGGYDYCNVCAVRWPCRAWQETIVQKMKEKPQLPTGSVTIRA